jgi:acyl carrier protein
VLYACADVTDADAMARAIDGAYAHFGGLHGVLHGAGVPGDRRLAEIKDCDPESCEPHFAAKLEGARVLEQVLEGRPVDFCMLHSSLAAVLGGIGHSAYAAANACLDAFARRHNRTSDVPWLSVNWDLWRLSGPWNVAFGTGATLTELGLTDAEGVQMLETVAPLAAAGHVLVSTGDLNARIDQWVNLVSLDVTEAESARASNGAAPERRPGIRTPWVAPRNEPEQLIARAWQDALGIDRIGVHDGFADLGGHSLVAVRIIAALRNTFGMNLPIRAIFDAPTVAELAMYIRNALSAEIEAMSEEEAQMLVTHP